MKKLILIGLVLSSINLSAQEKIQLTNPETKPNNTGYTIERTTLDEIVGIIYIQLRGDNGEPVSCVYNAQTNPTGAFLINALQKANLSSVYANNATTGTLHQRMFHRLVVMGESATVCDKPLIGTIIGTPQ